MVLRDPVCPDMDRRHHTCRYSFYLKNSEEGIEALKYLHNRGISDEIIDKFRIGLAPNLTDGLYQFLTKKGCSELDQIELGLIKQGENNRIHDVFRIRIMFPLASSTGKIVGFSGRIYTESNQAKYINSIESAIFHKGEILYNMHNAALPARQMDKIYLFEGFMDVIAAYRAGIKNGVATMGTALTKEHIQMLFSVTKNIVLCFDGDDAGIKAMRRSAKMLSSHNVIPEAIVLPNNQDPDEYIKDNGPEITRIMVQKVESINEFFVYTGEPGESDLKPIGIKNITFVLPEDGWKDVHVKQEVLNSAKVCSNIE
jgi:DNA primase